MTSTHKSSLTLKLQSLLEKRQLYRDQMNFTAADQIRQEVLSLGYELNDTPKGQVITQIEPTISQPQNSTLTLFGSGEISSIGRQVHEAAIKLIGKTSINIVLITTPAGFQPNVDFVYSEIANFFKVSLTNYHPQIKIIYANTRDDANNPKLIKPLYHADYIFTGPGSPTYAVKHLKNTLLYQEIINQVAKRQVSLSLASAAAIAFSSYALPVYEIYKVGEPLHWQSGLDGFSNLFKPLTIIPHFDNQEGGTKTDTSYCFMGKNRYQQLLKLLPPTPQLWGLDELTGVVIDLKSEAIQVIGKGKLHYLTP